MHYRLPASDRNRAVYRLCEAQRTRPHTRLRLVHGLLARAPLAVATRAPDHAALIPRLFAAALATGGLPAFQWVDNHARPLHRLLRANGQRLCRHFHVG